MSLFKNLVECEECKHVIREEAAQKIKIRGTDDVLTYCPEHKKNYSMVRYGSYYALFGTISLSAGYQPMAYFDVDEDGNPIGYVKVVTETTSMTKVLKRGRPSKKELERKAAKRVYQKSWYQKNKAKK